NSTQCSTVSFSLYPSKQGECRSEWTCTNQTEVSCKFSFFVSIQAVTGAPACCSSVPRIYKDTTRQVDVNGNIIPPVIFGPPVAITLPFTQNVVDHPVPCGWHMGWEIEEFSAGICPGSSNT